MRFGKHERIDLICALEIAIDSELEFRRGHMQPWKDGEIMEGFEEVVATTDKRIARFQRLRSKIREAINAT